MSAPLGWNAQAIAGGPFSVFLPTPNLLVRTTVVAIPTTPLKDRKVLWVFNVGTTTALLGNVNVGSANEFSLYASQLAVIPITDQVTLYARVGTGSTTLVCWEFA